MLAVSCVPIGVMIRRIGSGFSADSLVFDGGRASLDICLSFGWSNHHVKGLKL